MSNPYENMTLQQSLLHLSSRYLRKPECKELCENAAAKITDLETRLEEAHRRMNDSR